MAYEWQLAYEWPSVVVEGAEVAGEAEEVVAEEVVAEEESRPWVYVSLWEWALAYASVWELALAYVSVWAYKSVWAPAAEVVVAEVVVAEVEAEVVPGVAQVVGTGESSSVLSGGRSESDPLDTHLDEGLDIHQSSDGHDTHHMVPHERHVHERMRILLPLGATQPKVLRKPRLLQESSPPGCGRVCSAGPR